MYRQSPGRSLRSKGIRVKHVLQICLLLVVCFWLMYQVKHSHDKKKEFDESDRKISLVTESSDMLIKFGRKDIRPLPEERMNMNEKHDGAEEEEETTGEDMEENKNEDEPEDKNVEVKEDEGMDSGEDETDESEQEKLDVEGDFIDEKEMGDGEENENEEKDTKDGDDRMGKENSVDETDHDGDYAAAHEAREEHYRADDASSAVTHDTETAGVKNENDHEEDPDKQHENILEQELKENDETGKGKKGKELEEGGGIDGDGKQLDARNSETDENMVDSSHDNSSHNETVTEGSNPETSNNMTVVTIENQNLSLPNSTENELQSDNGQKVLIDDTLVEGLSFQATDNSTLNVDDNQFGSISTGLNDTKGSNTEEFSETSNDTESHEKDDASEADKSDTKDTMDEISESENNEHPEEIQQDSIDLSDSSNPLAEKDVRTNLDTLPEIRTEGTNTEDAAAE